VSPLELANVGATLDSDGVWCPPTPVASIADRDGTQLNWKQQSCDQPVPPELARTLTNAMYGDMHDPDGTAYDAAKAAGWTRVSASKTGTTQDYKSSAFLGYTPYYSAAVITWDYLNHPTSICVDPLRSCSNSEAQSGKGMAGGTVPAETWLSAMTPLHTDEPDTPIPESDPKYLEGASNTQVPNVVNMSLADAKAQLAAHEFTKVNVTYTTKTAAAANIVVAQDPEETALPGATINLTVSAGPSSG
jgi:membrane peptidoglycan carboxypeptidase